jgi:hypothetical protein
MKHPLFFSFRVFTLKLLDFGDVLKTGMWCYLVLRMSCILQEFKFPPTFLGYLTGHRLGRTSGAHREMH